MRASVREALIGAFGSTPTQKPLETESKERAGRNIVKEVRNNFEKI